jgi:chromosomal replication initiation ATPase DnaA
MTFGSYEASGGAFGRSEACGARRVEIIVASAFALGAGAIRDARRGCATVAFARQVAIYLSHTRLGLSYTEAGAYFGRDRTTVAHACRTVEEKREDPAVDAAIDFLERALEVSQDTLGRQPHQ